MALTQPLTDPRLSDVDEWGRSENMRALARTLYGPMLEYPLREGKGFRPALCLSVCQACDGRIEDALACDHEPAWGLLVLGFEQLSAHHWHERE